MYKSLRTAGLVALATIALAAKTQESFTLRLVLTEGQRTVYTQSVVVDHTMDAAALGGGAQDMEITMTSTMTHTFGRVDPEARKAALTIEVSDLKMEAEGMAGLMMDDGVPDGYKMTAKIDERNRISELKAEGMPAMMAAWAGGERGLEAAMNIFVFPEQPVRVGDTWEMKLPKSPMFGDAEPVMKVTLKEVKEVEGKRALVLEVKGEMPMNVNFGELMRDAPDAGPMGEMDMRMTGTVDSVATVTIEAATGRMLAMESTATSDIQMEIVDIGAKVPITGTTRTVIRLKE
jgi:hypothetical protein